MKVTYCENEYVFSIDLEAESVADAAFLARMAMNHTTKSFSLGAITSKSGNFDGWITVKKRKLPNQCIPKVK